MRFFADLHVHSKYSRATSSDCDFEHLAIWAQKKGIAVVGTGDFTHPAWAQELADKLVPAEPGLFRLRPDLEREVAGAVPPRCRAETRFVLEVEISTIYKKGDRTRKVHHLVFAPDLAQAAAVTARLSRLGNLAADGRPILGLGSRDLLEVVLTAAPDGFLVPAHIWTPWFSALGSKSGFDAITDCYGDLADHVFAAETGLSSDPAMNWRVSALDRYRLISSSDAHSPAKLGREASLFATALDYFAMRRALETGVGFEGTVEFFPEEGKYHLDGHRACGVRLEPAMTRAHGERCPKCGGHLTVGVLHRVEVLADRSAGARPAGAASFVSLVPLPEILGEILDTGPGSKSVARTYESLLGRIGPELGLLTTAPLEEVKRAGGTPLAEALARLRRGEVEREAGYDGEYGRIRLFARGELGAMASRSLFPATGEEAPAAIPALFPTNAAPEEPALGPRSQRTEAATAAAPPASAAVLPQAPPSNVTERLLAGLDPEQRAAATRERGPILIVAGPGTGKTRTLTHRIAWLVKARDVPPAECLALTFTRRAAGEMRERLQELVGEAANAITVATFHALGLAILREHADRLRLPTDFTVLDETSRRDLLRGLEGVASPEGLGKAIAGCKRSGEELRPELGPAFAAYERALAAAGAVDFDDLVALPVRLLESTPDLADVYRGRYRWIFVDEYQDVDALQAHLLRLLAPPGANVCVIGDPDQSIYGFRGADVGAFLRFEKDHPGATVARLERNYRSASSITTAAIQVIAPTTLVPGRRLDAVLRDEVPITLYTAASEHAEAEFVVRTIEGLVGGHSFFSVDSGRGRPSQQTTDLSFADVAVLYRTEAQVPPLREALARSGMPFQVHSHQPAAETPAAAVLARVLRAQPAGPSLAAQLEASLAMIRDEVDDEDTLAGLTALLRPLATHREATVADLLAVLATATGSDARDARADRLSLLTLHASKGLEFRVVFLVGCEDGLLPLRFGPIAADPAEERRLLFVGLTRARERLFLSRAKRRFWRGSDRENQPSPFLDAIAEALLAREQQAPRPPPVSSRQLTLF